MSEDVAAQDSDDPPDPEEIPLPPMEGPPPTEPMTNGPGPDRTGGRIIIPTHKRH
jgi:hypothetical protein